ncbi:MAG: FkbM family methyltransferase [Myxococcota bacterium]|nr:FkbM family methyltransferase [Myxococcota bacterium]
MKNADFEALIVRAEEALNAGWFAECADLLETVRLEFGESSRWANNCGVLAAQQSRHADALRYFQQAFRLDDSNYLAAVNLGKVLAMLGQKADAKAVLERLLPVVERSQPTFLPAVREALAALNAPPSGPEPEATSPEPSPSLIQRLTSAQLEGVGVRPVDGRWLPWVQHDGHVFHTLPVDHLATMRPDYDEAQLMELGWKQNIRDIEYRYKAATRPNPPHLIHDLRPGQTVVELGAYLGHYTLSAAHAVGPDGRVFAVEFIPDNYLVLRENLRQNYPETATAVHCGIWREPGVRTAYRQALQANSFVPSSLGGAYHGVDVPTESVDSLVQKYQIGSIDLLIVTINGAELDAFEGMTQSLPHIGAIAVAARYGDAGEDRVQSVCTWLNDAGFEPSIVGGDHVYGRRRSR